MNKFAMRAAIAAAAITPMVAFTSGVAGAEAALSPGVGVTVASANVTPVHACGPGLLSLGWELFHMHVPFPFCIKL